MAYATPLIKRRRSARWKRERYWSDPDYRLRDLNKTRARLGYPLFETLDQVETRGPQ